MRLIGAIGIWIITTATVAAQPVDGATARKMLFRADKVAVAFPAESELGEKDRATVEVLVTQNGFQYYGAIAYSPDEGLLSEALQGAFNRHSPADATRDALEACNAARARGTRGCAIAAHLVPRGWSPQPLQLSAGATSGFRAYRRGSGPKALAISPGTGEYAIAKGQGAEAAALAECNRLAEAIEAADCRIVVRD